MNGVVRPRAALELGHVIGALGITFVADDRLGPRVLHPYADTRALPLILAWLQVMGLGLRI